MSGFVAGMKLATRSIGDRECIFTATVLKVTDKTVTIDTDIHGVRRCKIHRYDDKQFIYPHGRYSMAATYSPEDAVTA